MLVYDICIAEDDIRAEIAAVNEEITQKSKHMHQIAEGKEKVAYEINARNIRKVGTSIIKHEESHFCFSEIFVSHHF